MFYGCSSLKKFFYISEWNTKNLNDMGGMFNGCKLLKNIPSKFIK